MSTSLLVQKMKKEAATRGLDVEIVANPLNKALEMLEGADILLLGPQIAYAKADAEAAAGDIPVAADYGRMNAAKILDDAQEIINNK